MTNTDRSIIRQIIGRCRVSDGPVSVIRYLSKRFTGKRRAFLALPYELRIEIISYALACHRANGELYRRIMYGTLGR